MEFRFYLGIFLLDLLIISWLEKSDIVYFMSSYEAMNQFKDYNNINEQIWT